MEQNGFPPPVLTTMSAVPCITRNGTSKFGICDSCAPSSRREIHRFVSERAHSFHGDTRGRPDAFERQRQKRRALSPCKATGRAAPRPSRGGPSPCKPARRSRPPARDSVCFSSVAPSTVSHFRPTRAVRWQGVFAVAEEAHARVGRQLSGPHRTHHGVSILFGVVLNRPAYHLKITQENEKEFRVRDGITPEPCDCGACYAGRGSAAVTHRQVGHEVTDCPQNWNLPQGRTRERRSGRALIRSVRMHAQARWPDTAMENKAGGRFPGAAAPATSAAWSLPVISASAPGTRSRSRGPG